MSDNNGYAAFNLYHSLQLHFKGKYDYIKYGGKTTMSVDNFQRRADKYFFYRLSRKYTQNELLGLYISNFLVDPSVRPGPLELEPAHEVFKKWLKIKNSLTYTFQSDIIKALKLVKNPVALIKVKDGQYPLLLRLVQEGEITLETMIIMNELMNFFPMWNEKISDDIIWPSVKLKCEKYLPFIHYDKDKMKSILKQALEEHEDF